MPIGGFIGGIARTFVNPMNIALMATPAGWANLAMRTVGAQIGMNFIQQIGRQLGLPQSAIDLAQAAFAQNMGMPGLARREISQAVQGLANDFSFSPRQTAEMIRTANDAIGDMAARLAEGEDIRRARAAGGAEGGGWLMALAAVMGEKLNAKAEQVQKLAGQITDKTPDKTAKFGAASQEFGIMMNATNNAIKSLGEGLSTMARKQ